MHKIGEVKYAHLLYYIRENISNGNSEELAPIRIRGTLSRKCYISLNNLKDRLYSSRSGTVLISTLDES